MKKALFLGSFDGLHKGHRAVLSVDDADFKIAVTFKIPPKAALTKSPSLIMSLQDKCEALKKIGIDEVLVLDFLEVKDIEALSFLNFLKESFSPTLISCGFNYRFGKDGKGDTALLERFCLENGIKFVCAKPVNFDGKLVSSTLLREYLKNGDIKKANSLLFEPFSFYGEVKSGDKRGRTIGFPTVNIKYPDDLVRIKFGVYKSRVLIDGKLYDGISNIGIRPTFETDYIASETFIKDFSGDLYGKELRIFPNCFLREEKKFSSIQELKTQIETDLNA